MHASMMYLGEIGSGRSDPGMN